MNKDKLISVEQFCVHYNIPHSFIDSLVEYELIHVYPQEKQTYLSLDTIAPIEKMMRMHYDLNVNFEGLDIINNLLQQIEELQQEMKTLKNKLGIYEKE